MEAIIEGLLYVQGDIGLTIKDIMNILEIDEDTAKRAVLSLKNYYDENKRGLRINFLGNTIKLTTREEHKEYYAKLLENTSSNGLSNSAIETLAVIAYNEPITRGEVDAFRGVDSSYVMRRLLAKGLIKECGKSDAPGRPILYKTTDEFLDYFGLASKEDLPSIEMLTEDKEEKDLYTSIYKEGDTYGRESSN
ncbi:MAG: SMC-Scp complex subunit ScpB [Bacilli bacterium]